MQASFERPFAIVTGASTGIGYELAKEFVRNGYDLLIAADEENIHGAAEELRTGEVAVQGLQLDLSLKEGVRTLYETARNFGRPLDAVAINAGVGVSGSFIRTDLEEELRLIDLNIVSAVCLAKLAARDMAVRGRGRILFTSSVTALTPTPFMAVYGASEAFLYSFAEALRSELKGSGVSVTALLPGATDTEFFHRAHMEDTELGQGKKDSPARVAHQGFEAMMRGEDHIVAGSMRVKLEKALADFLPESLKTGHQRGITMPGPQ